MRPARQLRVSFPNAMPIRKDYYDDEYEYYDDVDSNNNADDDTVAEDDYYEDNRDGEAVLFPSSPAASSDFFSGGDSTHLYPAYRDSKLSRGIGCFTEAIPKCFSLSSHLCCGCSTEYNIFYVTIPYTFEVD